MLSPYLKIPVPNIFEFIRKLVFDEIQVRENLLWMILPDFAKTFKLAYSLVVALAESEESLAPFDELACASLKKSDENIKSCI